MNLTNQEIILNMAKYVLAKCMRDRVEIVSFNDIARHCGASAMGVEMVAKYICSCLMTSARVEDSDIYEDGIVLMLKNNYVRV